MKVFINRIAFSFLSQRRKSNASARYANHLTGFNGEGKKEKKCIASYKEKLIFLFGIV